MPIKPVDTRLEKFVDYGYSTPIYRLMTVNFLLISEPKILLYAFANNEPMRIVPLALECIILLGPSEHFCTIRDRHYYWKYNAMHTQKLSTLRYRKDVLMLLRKRQKMPP